MNSSDRNFWFPVKVCGWGWGLPVRWQGWLVLAAYLVLLFGGIAWFAARKSVLALPAAITLQGAIRFTAAPTGD